MELTWHFQTRKLLGSYLYDCCTSLEPRMCCIELCPQGSYIRDRGRSAGVAHALSASLSLNSKAFSTLASAREKSGSFYSSDHIADTFSGSEVIRHRLSWQMGLKKTLSALEPLRRKVRHSTYTQDGVTMPGAISHAGQSLLQASQHLNFGSWAC